MSSVSPPDSGASQNTPTRRRLWRWFFVGFLVVFLGLAAFYPTLFYDGQSVRQTVLWQYYRLEIQLEMNSTGNLGPTSGNMRRDGLVGTRSEITDSPAHARALREQSPRDARP